MIMRTILDILVVLMAASLTSAQSCNYNETSHCVETDATGTLKLPVPTLFSSPPNIVYAIDNVTGGQLEYYQDYSSFFTDTGDYDGPVQEVGWWLEFDNETINYDLHQNMSYFIILLETGLSNPLGGADNHCGDLLGSECIHNLKSMFANLATTTDGENTDVLVSAYTLNQSPLKNLSCPHDIFGDVAGIEPPLTASCKQTSAFGKLGLASCNTENFSLFNKVADCARLVN